MVDSGRPGGPRRFRPWAHGSQGRGGPVAALALAALLAPVGCVHHVHHHERPSKVVIDLDREHDDPEVVVIHKRPRPHRHCWRHRRHWHCRR